MRHLESKKQTAIEAAVARSLTGVLALFNRGEAVLQPAIDPTPYGADMGRYDYLELVGSTAVRQLDPCLQAHVTHSIEPTIIDEHGGVEWKLELAYDGTPVPESALRAGAEVVHGCVRQEDYCQDFNPGPHPAPSVAALGTL